MTERELSWGWIAVEDIKAALEGESEALETAFIWCITPQGRDFWAEEAKELSVEGQEALKAFLREVGEEI